MIYNTNGKIICRYDTSTNWSTANPVLEAGEIGIESNTGGMKFGDGSTAWNSLSFFAFPTYTNLSDIGITTSTCTVEDVFQAMVTKGGTWSAYVNQGTLSSGITNLPVGYGIIRINVVSGQRFMFEYTADLGKKCYRIIDNYNLRNKTVNDLCLYTGTKIG